jgi:hypothetical protein
MVSFMTIYYKDNKKVLFIHNPKTGGTSIHHVLDSSGWSFVKAVKINSITSTEHIGYSDYIKLFGNYVAKFDFIFTIVRNPYDKLQSEYSFSKTTLPFASWFTDSMTKYALSTSYSNNHFKHQHEYVGPDVRVYRFETGVYNIVNDLEKQLQTTLLLKNTCLNVSNKLYLITETDKELIYNYYSKDFAVFGYDK